MNGITPEILTGSNRVARRGLVWWLMVRLTGIILSVLVLGHFALTHILTDVAQTNSGFVAARWASGFVVGWDWIMLAAAVLHGVAGLRVISDDYAPVGLRRAAHWLLAALALVMVALGTWTIAASIT